MVPFDFAPLLQNALPAMFSSVGSQAQQYGQNVANQMAEQRQFDRSLQLMEKSHQMNSYEQMSTDLAAAGLHPSLLLSQGKFNPVSQPAAPAAIPNSVTPESFLQNLLLASQIKAQDIENSYAPVLKEAELENLTKTTQKLGTEIKLNEQQISITDSTMPFVIGKSEADWNEVVQKVKLLEEQIVSEQKQHTLQDDAHQLNEDTHKLNDYNLSFEKFKKEFRQETGIQYSENEWVMLYSLCRKGELTPIFENIASALKSVLSDGVSTVAKGAAKGAVNLGKKVVDAGVKGSRRGIMPLTLRRMNPAMNLAMQMYEYGWF